MSSRVAEAVAIFIETIELMSGTRAIPPQIAAGDYSTFITTALAGNDEFMGALAQAVDKIAHAYLGADTEFHARGLINSVAATNRAKRIILPVLDGDGKGTWECIVRRSREAQPAIIMPGSKRWTQ